MNLLLEHYNHWVAIFLLLAGLYTIIACSGLFKKLIGLAVFQTSSLLLFVSAGYVRGGNAPTLTEDASTYINPLPHVLVLTAIVVGIATLGVGLALLVRIREEYGTLEEDALAEAEDDR